MYRTALASLLLVAACGGSSARPTPTPPTPTVWKEMNAEQRKKFMEDVVMPKMKDVFTKFDAKYADMNCKTCHGAGADDGSFEMPNPDIAPLPNTPEAFQAKVAADAEWQRFTPFMVQQVEPAMGELLHLTPFDPKTMTGEFGCANCHTLVDAQGNRAAGPGDKHEE
ncbi:MAG TPA: hypothetical protein VHE35_18915 [Kofleriaceae bacterium]|nr:hypothetical protein [Kofleriaceae bacterium]